MVFVIAFKDGEDINYWRIENYTDEGEFIGYGDVKTFETKEQANEKLKLLEDVKDKFIILHPKRVNL